MEILFEKGYIKSNFSATRAAVAVRPMISIGARLFKVFNSFVSAT